MCQNTTLASVVEKSADVNCDFAKYIDKADKR